MTIAQPNNFLEKMQEQFSKRLPFVAYCKPGKHQVTGIFQLHDKAFFAEDFSETGFVMAPFESGDCFLIPENGSEVFVSELPSDKYEPQVPQPDENPKAKADFEALVKKGILAIEKGEFGKVVLSRQETVAVPNLDFTGVFEKLLHAYPNAFRYCWFHPKTGMWMGATPEQLLRSKDNRFNTVALAGTQPFIDTEHVFWQEKEKAEQQFVTDFISGGLRDKVSQMSLSEPYTARAGNLLHIKTDIEGTLNADSGLREVLDILHPTPAVCGFPKLEAKKFILENEGYNREFYSGFLGELHKDFAENKAGSDLYVNLRCMKTETDTALLFIGCGITKDSVPENEFTETVNKSLTMKKVLI
jgi:isochorismate synthase